MGLFLVTFVVRVYFIPSISMTPTLRVGDLVLVDLLAYRLHPPRPGDVAVFMPPVPSGGIAFVKRVIGVPGDRIRIADGVVYRNGIPLDEPYERSRPRYTLSIRDYDLYVNGRPLDPRLADVPPRSFWRAPDRIPPGFYLVLGDDRNRSDDSHVWGFAQLGGRYAAGPLAGRPDPGFIGRAFLICWPPTHLRILTP
jgi:signal peptidase I